MRGRIGGLIVAHGGPSGLLLMPERSRILPADSRTRLGPGGSAESGGSVGPAGGTATVGGRAAAGGMLRAG
eukprot:11436962-Alexandrium_andersonii.AAC.1